MKRTAFTVAPLPRLLWPAAISAILGVPIVMALAGRVPNVVDAEIAVAQPGWAAVPVDLGVTDLPEGSKVARIGLFQVSPERLAGRSEVRLMFVTYDGTPALLGGEIVIRGTDCVFRTEPGAALANNDYLAFKRGSGCWPLRGDVSGRMDLVLSFRGRGHVGLLTYFVAADAVDPQWITLSARDPAPNAPIPVVSGRYADTFAGPTRRRIDLLAYMWQVSPSSRWLSGIVGLALVLLFVGSRLIARDLARVSSAGALRTAPAVPVGVATIGLAFALLYAVLVPPLQAPDEPDHLLAFADVAGRPTLTTGIADLARIDHFDRIRFHGPERFRRTDVGRPLERAWGSDVFAHRVAERSVTTWLWWRLLAEPLRPFGASASLLGIRLGNALLFALFLGVATAILRFAAADVAAAPHMVTVALLLVPTLPFFATHVSEFAILTSGYVLVAAVAAGLFLDGRETHLLGLPLGLAIAIVLASGRSALPFVMVPAALLAGRAIMGSASHDSTRGGLRHSAHFWGGLGVGLGVFAILSTQEFRNGLWPGDVGQIPPRIKVAAELLRRHPWSAVLAAPVGFVAERAMCWLRKATLHADALLAAWARVACYVASMAAVGSLVASVFVQFPVMVDAQVTRPSSAAAYAADVVRVAATGLRLRDHDFYLSSSFWAGFGWIDTLPGDLFVSVVLLFAAVPAIGLLIQTGRSGDRRRTAWLGLLAGGSLIALMAYAVSSYHLHRSLHGRYLVGLYLTMLGIGWSGVSLLPRVQWGGVWSRLGLNREWMVAAVAAGIHAYVVWFMLHRYFG